MWTPSESAWHLEHENPCLRKILLHLTPSVKHATVQLKRLQFFSDNTTWSMDYVEGLQWNAIDDALSDRSTLERLDFELFCDEYTGEEPTFKDEIKAIRDRLPKLVRKGIVDVVSPSTCIK